MVVVMEIALPARSAMAIWLVAVIGSLSSGAKAASAFSGTPAFTSFAARAGSIALARERA